MANHPLQAYRERAGITLDTMAERVGVSKATLSRVENGKQSPSLDLVAKLKAESEGQLSADDFLPQAPTQPDHQPHAHADERAASDPVDATHEASSC